MTPKQKEDWFHIVTIAEENPDLPYLFIKDILAAKAEEEAGIIEPYIFG